MPLQNLASLKLKTIMLTISGVVLTVAIVSGIQTVISIQTLNDGANSLYHDVIPGITKAEKMNVAFGDLRIGGAEHMLAHSAQDSAQAVRDVKEANQTFLDLADKHKAVNEDEKKLFAEIMANYRQYTAFNDRLVELVAAQRTEEADRLFNNEMRTLYAKIGDDLENLVALNVEIGDKVNENNDAVYAITRTEIIWLTIVSISASLGLLLYSVLALLPQISRIEKSMQTLAAGDKQAAIPYIDRSNELGSMAKAIQVFKENMLETDRLRAEQEEAKKTAEQSQKDMMHKMANDFESSVGQIVSTIAAAATELSNSAEEMSKLIAETSKQSSSIAQTSNQTLVNVQAVASATEELSSSVKEISQQITKSTDQVRLTVERNSSAGASAQSLAEASQQINQIAGLIENIASQINLLALNATIESARAGDAGKGFAVVASEVKSLAGQTSNATNEIGGRIQSVQDVSKTVLDSISLISESVQMVNQYSSTIAAAVEEQSAVTNEISHNMSNASNGVAQISDSINMISSSAQQSAASAQQVLAAAQELSKQAERMNKEVSLFLQGVRAA